MKPLDPRLLRYAAGARVFLAVGALIGAVQTACTIAFAWIVTEVVVRCIAGDDPAAIAPLLGWLVAVVVVRAVLVWASEVNALRGAVLVKQQLREKVVEAVVRLGPGWASRRASGGMLTLITTGLDSLDNYFARYLPQLIMTAIAMPVLVLVVLLQDPLSAIFVIVTIPLIPVFMILIGWATQAVQRAQWEKLGSLSSGFVDTVGGLATLRIFGRAERQGARIRAVTEQYRVTTMKVLRMSFLSGFVLELAASLSVALVAVSIGLRLVDGSLALSVGLFVLILTPDIFLPLRNVGAQFHAAADGVAAADDVFGVLAEAEAIEDAPAGETDARAEHSADELGVRFLDVAVDHGGGVVTGAQSFVATPGTVTVITGESGAGKSSLVAALLGFAQYSGSITIDGRDEPADARRAAVAWAGQRPGLVSGSVVDNVTLGATDAPGEDGEAAVLRALTRAGIDIDPRRMLDASGAGLSGGQMQRVAVARAFYRLETSSASILVLDEPTSALDDRSEAALVAGVNAAAADGATVIVVSHRSAVIDAADTVFHLGGPDSTAPITTGIAEPAVSTARTAAPSSRERVR